MVDLSKAKAGDTVVFRCGGRAVIKNVIEPKNDGYSILRFCGDERMANSYMNNGHYHFDSTSLMDITEVIPANVAPMTYKTKERMIEALNWIENNWDKTSEAEMFQAIKEAKIHLTSTPEHDIKEGSK